MTWCAPFRKLSLVENRCQVQLPVMDDSETSDVPKVTAGTMQAQGGVTKSRFGGGEEVGAVG